MHLGAPKTGSKFSGGGGHVPRPPRRSRLMEAVNWIHQKLLAPPNQNFLSTAQLIKVNAVTVTL
jgi:hypothetical protein